MLILKYGQYLNKTSLIKNVLPVTSRMYCDFAHLWKPGKYPETKEEREAAARKYNLIPEDYKPTAEERGMGDYPDIERLTHQIDARPYGPDYDEPFCRRNYGEPLSEFFIAQQLEPPDQVDRRKAKWVVIGLFLFVLLINYGATIGPTYEVQKTVPKHYPPEYFPGVRPKVHYTFEQNE